MTVQVLKKWGNSPAVRLPVAIMEAAALQVEQQVQIRAEPGRIVIEPVIEQPSLEQLLAAITDENLHGEVDFGGPQGQELL